MHRKLFLKHSQLCCLYALFSLDCWSYHSYWIFMYKLIARELVKIYNKINYVFPIFVTCLLFTFVYILSLSSTFSIVLFNSSISTAKIVNYFSFFFFTLFCFPAAIQSDLSLGYHVAGRAACGPCHLHIPASRLEEQKPGANPFHPFSFRITWQKLPTKGTITETQSLKFHKAAINKWWVFVSMVSQGSQLL